MKRKTNILVLTYWSYKDALIQAYTLPYLRIIKEQISDDSKIYLVTFEQKHQRLSLEEHDQIKQQLLKNGIIWKPSVYKGFSVDAFFRIIFLLLNLLQLIIFHNIRIIHAWCMMGGTIGFLLSKLTGRTLIIDSYEPHAESMVENGTWKKNSLPFKLLFYFEKKLTQHAKIIISATEEMRNYSRQKYNVDIKTFYVKPACVDPDFFSEKHRKNKELLRQLNLEDKLVCVYAGKFGGIYLTKEVFRFFKVAQNYWGDKFRALLLTNYPEEELKNWAHENNLDWKNIIVKFVNHKEVADYLGLGDFAITPVKSVPTKRYCTPIKDGEYWALGLPVVITKNISDDSEIIRKNDIGAVIEELNDESYVVAVKKIDEILFQRNREETTVRIQNIARQLRDFDIARNIYADIYYYNKSTLL